MTSEAALAKLSYVLGQPGLGVDGRKEVCAPLAGGYVSRDGGCARGADSGRQRGPAQECGGSRGTGLLMVQRASSGAGLPPPFADPNPRPGLFFHLEEPQVWQALWGLGDPELVGMEGRAGLKVLAWTTLKPEGWTPNGGAQA